MGIELALLCELGRLRIGAVELEAATERNSAVRILAHDLAQAKEFALLLSLDDPFDRMIVAAARAVEKPLITADRTVTASGLADVIWD